MALPENRLLQTAIALAEELHFSTTAMRLRIDQATVSRRIQELEYEVGFLIFERNHQTVELTEAGRKFIEEVRVGFVHLDRAIRNGRSVKEEAEVVLNVGRSPYTDPFFLTTLLSISLPLYPRLKLELSQQFSLDLIRDVLTGSLDLAIVTEPHELTRLAAIKIAECPFYIAMQEEDELAFEDSVSLDMLSGRPWVIFERRMHPPVYDAVLRLAEQRKATPARLHHIVVPEDAYSLVVDEGAVAFVVKSGAIRIARDGITVRPLAEDTLTLKTYLASRADQDSKVVSELVRAFMRKLSAFTRTTPFPVRASA